MNLRQKIRYLRSLILVSVLLLSQDRLLASLEAPKPTQQEKVTHKSADSSKPFKSLRQEAEVRALAVLIYREGSTKINYTESLRIARLCEIEGIKRGITAVRLVSIILVESAANHRAVSSVGARGLMQIMPETAAFIARNLREAHTSKRSLFDHSVNVRYGSWYYRHLLDYYHGNEKMALAAYNWGPGAISERLERGEGLPQKYWQSVLGVEARLQRRLAYETEQYYWRSGPGGTFPEADYSERLQPAYTGNTKSISLANGERIRARPR